MGTIFILLSWRWLFATCFSNQTAERLWFCLTELELKIQAATRGIAKHLVMRGVFPFVVAETRTPFHHTTYLATTQLHWLTMAFERSCHVWPPSPWCLFPHHPSSLQPCLFPCVPDWAHLLCHEFLALGTDTCGDAWCIAQIICRNVNPCCSHDSSD